MTKVYYITNSEGDPKRSWEEILCDHVDVHPTGLVCFYSKDDLMIAYKLLDGEALVCTGEE